MFSRFLKNQRIYFNLFLTLIKRFNLSIEPNPIPWILVHRAAQNTLKINCIKRMIGLKSESFNVQLKSLTEAEADYLSI